MRIELKPEERIEELGGGIRVIQNPGWFCYGTDAVMLADFVSAKPQDKLMDFCTGTAIIPLLLSARTVCRDMTALEIQEEVADMARRSVRLNNLEERIDVRCVDLRRCRELFRAESFDVVTCNPPYMRPNTGKENQNDSKTIARHEICCTLEDVLENAAYLLKTGGRFYLVHRPERLADIFYEMKRRRLEPKRMQFVHADLKNAPSLVLVEGQKGRKSGLIAEKPVQVKNAADFLEK